MSVGEEVSPVKGMDAPPTRLGRLAGIEGVRAVAAYSVLVWHVWAHPVASDTYGVGFGPFSRALDTMRVGVAMFFVLSGFLLFRPFAASIIRGRPLPSIRNYAVNRTLRIVPLFWTVVLVLAVVWERGLLRRPQQLLADMTFLQGYVPAYQPTWNEGDGIMPAWSLCVEVVFYAVLPLLAYATVRLARRRGAVGIRIALAPVAMLGIVGVVSTELYRVGLTDSVFESSFLTHAHWFAIGMGLAVLRVCWEDGRVRLPGWWRLSAGAAVVALAVLAVGGSAAGRLTFLEEHTILALACGILVATIALPKPGSRLIRVLESRPFVVGGLLSYGVFLWHEPILRFYRSHGLTWPGQIGFFADFLLVAVTATVFAAATYALVERPALAHKRRTGQTPARADGSSTASLKGSLRRLPSLKTASLWLKGIR